MNINNNDLKPFYIYTDKNCLYIKNINEHTEKLSNNIYAYSANIDESQKIHICCIDLNGKLIHITNYKNHWRKKIICRVFNSIRNIKNMRLFIINNYLNVFVVEQSSLNDRMYKVCHFNFTPKNYNVSKFYINNIYKNEESIYKLNIDDLSNVVFEYNTLNASTRSINNHIIIYNSESRSWITPNNLLRGDSEYFDKYFMKHHTIKQDIFEYSHSINYKL